MSEEEFADFRNTAFILIGIDEEEEVNAIIKKRNNKRAKAESEKKADSESFEEKIVCKDASKSSAAETADKKSIYNSMEEEDFKNERKEILKSDRLLKIVDTMRNNPSITIDNIAKELNCSVNTVMRDINILKKHGIISRQGAKKKGQWEVVRL